MSDTMTAARLTDRLARSGWWPIFAGLALLYLPTWWRLAVEVWPNEEQSQGPIVLLVSGFLFWLRRRGLSAPGRPAPLSGWALLVTGLLLYALGRSQQIPSIETASQIPVLFAILLLAGADLRKLWFPVLYLAFMIPLPGLLINEATGPLKQSVSAVVEDCLYQLGYPVARSGVTLMIGQYQLLVADACSGLNSIIALSSLGLLYVHLMWRRRWPGNGLLIAAILPIAYAANILRVVFIVLLTYYAGDEVAQGILHATTSLVLFSSAILLLFALDALLLRLIPAAEEETSVETAVEATAKATAKAAAEPVGTQYPLPLLPLRAAALAMLATAGLALALAPKPPGHAAAIDWQALIPQRFGGWHLDRSLAGRPWSLETREKLGEIYDQTLYRTYSNGAGQHLMLVLGYGKSSEIHHPETCYPAQGFPIFQEEKAVIALDHGKLPVQHLLIYRGSAPEPITYWVLAGNRLFRFDVAWRLQLLKYNLFGHVPDGLLFRVSSLNQEPKQAYALQADFIQSLIAAVPPQTRVHLIGTP